MAYSDAQLSDIVVVLDDATTEEIDRISAFIKSAGGTIEQVNQDEAVIEGTVATSKVKEIQAMPGVKYVRSVFVYDADYPVGDPRNKDVDDRNEDIPR